MIMIFGELMRLSLIAALTPARVIGKNNRLPWHLPADLQYFKKVTLHKTVIMGRKTFESIGKPLPQRKNIIITRNPHFMAPAACQIFPSVEKALDFLKTTEEEIFIIGGAEIFAQTISLANYLYLTFIDENIQGDTYFPQWDEKHFHEILREPHRRDEKNRYNYSFVVLERI